ncbi:MAG: hypothetical protein PHY79_17810 [Anaerolineae bacterium]|nr:hypothetical protein [Anaerolineae bacterium]
MVPTAGPAHHRHQEEGLDEFRETKHVHWAMSMEPKAWWYPYEIYARER